VNRFSLQTALLFLSPLVPIVACVATEGTPGDEGAGPAPSGSSDPSNPPGTSPSIDGSVVDGTVPDLPWEPPVETGNVTFPYKAYRCDHTIRQVSPAKPTAEFHDPAASSTPTVRNLHLTIAGAAATSVVIQWSTDLATKQTEVRFGEAPDKLEKVARGFSFVSGNRRQHEVHLCGLKPGSTTYYDAGGIAFRSKVHKFTTAPDGPGEVTILVGGDTRSAPSIWGSMEANALAQGPTAMILTGDAVLTGGVQTQWDALWEASPELFAEVPGIWAHGNHEGLDELYFQQLALPDHGGAVSEIEQWFATSYGPLQVIVLNDTVSSSSLLSGAEKQFLETTLAGTDRTRTPFITAVHHKPMYTTSNGHASNTSLRAQWGPLFAQHKVEVVLNGHVHSYESTAPIQAGTTTVTTPEIGTRFINFGGGGAGLYDFAATQPWIQKRETTNGFGILKINATTMTWTAFRRDGSTLETFTIPKH
jgi:hypothetical protein